MAGSTALVVFTVTLETVVEVPLIVKVTDDVFVPSAVMRISSLVHVSAAIAVPLAAQVVVGPPLT
jgi:hypothetical protein